MGDLGKKAIAFLGELIRTPSPSGHEGACQRLVAAYVKPFVDRVESDVMGNLVAVRNPEGRPRVMLAAHCDEVGLMVKYIADDGFLSCAAVGCPALPGLIGQPVEILGRQGLVPGVVMGKRPTGEEAVAYKVEGCWIDIGARDRADAEAVVRPGDPVTPVTGYRALRGGRVMGRGFDDRIGVFVVAEVLRRLQGENLDAAVYGVSTVQEEVGSRGAKPCAYRIEPDIGIAIDVTAATDCPETDKRTHGDVALGRGPVLLRGANVNPILGARLEAAAAERAIPVQFDGYPGPTPTDASMIQVSRGGVATALVKIPVRYMHFPLEVISLADVEYAVALLAEWIKGLRPDVEYRQPFA